MVNLPLPFTELPHAADMPVDTHTYSRKVKCLKWWCLCPNCQWSCCQSGPHYFDPVFGIIQLLVTILSDTWLPHPVNIWDEHVLSSILLADCIKHHSFYGCLPLEYRLSECCDRCKLTNISRITSRRQWENLDSWLSTDWLWNVWQ